MEMFGVEFYTCFGALEEPTLDEYDEDVAEEECVQVD